MGLPLNQKIGAIPMEPQSSQVDALAVIDALTLEVATLTRRAVVAEQRVMAMEAEKSASKESK